MILGSPGLIQVSFNDLWWRIVINNLSYNECLHCLQFVRKDEHQHIILQNQVYLKKKDRGCRDCSGSQKVGARKIARCQFRSQLKNLQGANFFEPKLWMIACTTTSFMFSFMYKWSGFVCTNVNVGIVLLFFISISSSKTKRFI